MTRLVRPEVNFIPLSQIEAAADSLLVQLEEYLDEPLTAPVKVEFVAEGILDFCLKSEEFTEADALAYIDPNEMIICTNLARLDYFDHAGYEFTWAHEIGHFILDHFVEVGEQLPLELEGAPKKLIYRENINESDRYSRHEFQANKFAANLVMPRRLLVPETQELNLRQWTSIYFLAEKFGVTSTIMVRRLSELKLAYVEGKTIFASKEEAAGQLPLL